MSLEGLNDYYVPDPVLYTLLILTHLILITIYKIGGLPIA